MTNLTLLTDHPLGEGNDFENDGLGFNVYAKVLGNAVLSTTGPFTIGIFGEWGTGKTSLMRMIERYLNDRGGSDVTCVWFNAWRYEKEEHPIVPLVARIIYELERQKDLAGNIGKASQSLIRALRAVAYGFSAKSKVAIPGFAEIEAAFVAKDMIERERTLTPDPLLERSLYYEAFETLSKIELNKENRIVVFIDDLDRCFPDLAIKLLESIKLVLSQPGFIFVLGVSRSVIEGYLQYRYEKEYGLPDFNGRSYLDKIVQLPFYIPPHSGRMKGFSKNLLNILESDDAAALGQILNIIGVACANNPRTTIRFVNNLLIDRAINRSLVEIGELEKEIDIGYFAISRSLQQNWSNEFSLLLASNDLCLTVSKWETVEDIDRYVQSEKADLNSIEFAKKLLSDSGLRDLLVSQAGKEWLENIDLRRGAIQFLLTKRADSYSIEEYMFTCPQCSNQFIVNVEIERGKVSSNTEHIVSSKKDIKSEKIVKVTCPNCEYSYEIDLETARAARAIYR